MSALLHTCTGTGSTVHLYVTILVLQEKDHNNVLTCLFTSIAGIITDQQNHVNINRYRPKKKCVLPFQLEIFWVGRFIFCFFYIHICDPFYRNETLLCNTSNGDMAENTCGGHFFLF